MRKKVIAGNWKMNKDLNDSVKFAKELKFKVLNVSDHIKIVICPPFTSLSAISEIIKGSKIGLGAQNMHYEDEGAYTGEICAKMIKSTGCQYVILGHSERRTYFSENDELINKKVKKALQCDLIPIVCVGETLSEREQGRTTQIIEEQISGTFKDLHAPDINKIIIAYEPVWAIGTGKNATSGQAQEIHFFIRKTIAGLSNNQIAENIEILYGGSMKPENSAELLKQPDIDGGLIGGACLKSETFLGIIQSI
jgi:triosephosphate isomerase